MPALLDCLLTDQANGCKVRSMKNTICTGSRTQVKSGKCPVCKTEQQSHPSGRLYTHMAPRICSSLSYQKGRGGAMWPTPCTAT